IESEEDWPCAGNAPTHLPREDELRTGCRRRQVESEGNRNKAGHPFHEPLTSSGTEYAPTIAGRMTSSRAWKEEAVLGRKRASRGVRRLNRRGKIPGIANPGQAYFLPSCSLPELGLRGT